MAKYAYKRRTLIRRLNDAVERVQFEYEAPLEVEWVLLPPKTGRYPKDNPFKKSVLAFDGGTKHTGFAFCAPYGVILGVITDTDGLGLFNAPPMAVALQKVFKPQVIAVEGAFCPSSEALLLTGALVGALSLEKDINLVIVSPHRKPPFAKEKVHTEKIQLGLEFLSRWYDIKNPDAFVPAQLWQHSISALGVAVSALKKEGDG